MFRRFRLCSDFSDNVGNAQNLFRHCPNVQTFLRICRMFRMFSQCSECSESVPSFSEFLAQIQVYSEFLDFVEYAFDNCF